MIVQSFCAEDTYEIGKKIGQEAQPGQVICLYGDLGVGKTVFTKGLADGLGITESIQSPTFTIVREYEEGRLPLYHFDVYRIGDDPDSIDLDDFLYGDGVTIIEWGELLDESLLGDYLLISITHHGDGRQLLLESFGPRSKEIQEEMVNG